VIGVAPLVDQGTGVLKASLNAALIESAPVGQMKPGAKTVSVVYDNPSLNYTVANRSGTMSIKAEDARVGYTGPTTVKGCATCTTTVVPLTATVQDVWFTADRGTDAGPGDISKASVMFVNRTTGAVIGTATLVVDNPLNPTYATATFNWTAPVTATSQNFSIGMVVGNYYVRNSTADNASVTVSK
jgi:hypothetical protein